MEKIGNDSSRLPAQGKETRSFEYAKGHYCENFIKLKVTENSEIRIKLENRFSPTENIKKKHFSLENCPRVPKKELSA